MDWQINHQGWFDGVRQLPSPYFDKRPVALDISLLVIHCISLPPERSQPQFIDALFTGTLDADAHPYFATIAHHRVSAHLLIDRQGLVTQYVALDDRAWHAGVSSFQGRSRCNDYAIGIELEGRDDEPFTQAQYQSLLALTGSICQRYPNISLGRIVGHQDIAPGRKTDPGIGFDWAYFRRQLLQEKLCR